jgi:hypothetical protein
MLNMFSSVTLPTATYSAILVGWAAQVVKTGVTFTGGLSKYDASGATARATLTGTYTWTITDGGPA